MHFHYNDEQCACGWHVVAILDEPIGYEWHDLVVMTDTSGRLFWAEGSGCSCNDVSDMEESEFAPIDRTVGEYRAAVRDFPADPTDKIPFLKMAGQARFGVATHLERNRVTVYA